MSIEKLKPLVSLLDVGAKIAIALIAGLWVLHTYPDSREKEFRKSYWDQQTSLYFNAAQTTAKIATLDADDSERNVAVKAYWQLYWGQMTVVESNCERCDQVDQAMIRFGRCLTNPGDTKPVDDCDAHELEQRSIALGKACRNSIGLSWDKKLESLSQDCPSDGSCPK